MPDLSEEQEIFAATETTEDTSPAAAPSESPVADTVPLQGQQQVDPQAGQQERHVPYAALKEEREARKALQAEMAELRSAFLRGQQPQQAPKPPEPEPDLWDDPTKYLQRQIDPVQQAVFETREFYSRRLAEQQHTPEKVSEAYNALKAAIDSGQLDGNAVQAELRKSMDPYGDIMGWHQKNSVLSEIGTDPKAYEERLRAKILAELQGGSPDAQPTANARSADGRFAPATTQTQPLPSLNRSYGNAGATQSGSITEEDIFNAAPAFGKRRA